jgi:hypothetical protein
LSTRGGQIVRPCANEMSGRPPVDRRPPLGNWTSRIRIERIVREARVADCLALVLSAVVDETRLAAGRMPLVDEARLAEPAYAVPVDPVKIFLLPAAVPERLDDGDHAETSRLGEPAPQIPLIGPGLGPEDLLRQPAAVAAGVHLDHLQQSADVAAHRTGEPGKCHPLNRKVAGRRDCVSHFTCGSYAISRRPGTPR